jgi:hypothetical protein
MDPASSLFPVLLSAKRGELELRSALGVAIHPEVFRPEVAGALKDAWLGARKAGDVIHRVIVMAQKPGNVIDFAGARGKRAKVFQARNLGDSR